MGKIRKLTNKIGKAIKKIAEPLWDGLKKVLKPIGIIWNKTKALQLENKSYN